MTRASSRFAFRSSQARICQQILIYSSAVLFVGGPGPRLHVRATNLARRSGPNIDVWATSSGEPGQSWVRNWSRETGR